jgi:hypothetical protein
MWHDLQATFENRGEKSGLFSYMVWTMIFGRLLHFLTAIGQKALSDLIIAML